MRALKIFGAAASLLAAMGFTGLTPGSSVGGSSAGPQSVQQAPEPQPTISMETNLVVLPVTVLDSHGGVVAGLTAQQFQVFDNGRPQSIDFFVNDDVPATIGLVVDCSSSMRSRRDEVTAAASSFAAASHPLDELFTMNFNEEVWPGLTTPFALAANFASVRAALANAPARGMTALYDAVEQSLDHLKLGTRDRKVLIVVSDGGDNASAHTLEDVMASARRTNTVIYTVMIVDPDNRDARPAVLKALARETGGRAFSPRGAVEITKVFTQIALEIRSAYTIGFSPATASRNMFRSIKVTVADARRGQLVAHTRRGYYAPTSRRVD